MSAVRHLVSFRLDALRRWAAQAPEAHSPRRRAAAGGRCGRCAGVPAQCGGRAGMHWKGGRSPPPPRAPSLCPATLSLTPSASLSGICNRQ